MQQVRVRFFQLCILVLHLRQEHFSLDHQVIALARFANDRLQLVGVPRLGDVAINVPLVDRVNHRMDVGVAREQESHGFRAFAAYVFEELYARRRRHALVRHDDMDFLLVENIDALGGARCAEHAVIEAQQVLHAFDNVGLVVNDENGVAVIVAHE